MTKVLVLYCLSYGHVETMAHAVAAGAREAGVDVVVKRVPDLVPEGVVRKSGYKLDQAAPVATVDELANCDAIADCYRAFHRRSLDRRRPAFPPALLLTIVFRIWAGYALWKNKEQR